MRIIFVLASAIVVMQFGVEDVNTEAKMEVATNARMYYLNVDNSILKPIPEESREKMLLQDDIALKERQGDQVLKELVKSPRSKRQISTMAKKWPNAVFYTFNTTDERVKKLFTMGAKAWSDFTCVDFVENKTAEDKVIVIKGDSCWADVGRFGGEQRLSLHENVREAAAVHEIGHVLGLGHTMSRPDRDNYIKIEWKNVIPNAFKNFEKMSENESDLFGLAYDYGSVMHYDRYSASVNKLPTMLATDPLYKNTMGSEIISFSDILTINMHYGCNEICDKYTSAKCLNEGFPHPRNCSICICPNGYGGSLCDRRPPGCGENLVATRAVQTVKHTLGFGSDFRDRFDFCHYMILAPSGKKIQVKAHLTSNGFAIPGCIRGGIEIKAQKDQKMTGYRFCSRSASQEPIVSSLNRLPLILFNRYGKMEVRFTYYYVD